MTLPDADLQVLSARGVVEEKKPAKSRHPPERTSRHIAVPLIRFANGCESDLPNHNSSHVRLRRWPALA